MELFKAHDQWMNRPNDERFETLQAMYDATNGYRQTAKEAVVKQGQLTVVPTKAGLALKGKSGQPALMTHWAFNQVCGRLAAPPNYLRTLSPDLAAANLNYCIKDDGQDDAELALLLHEDDGAYVARAFTSTKYTRIWNSEVIERLMGLPKGWRVPPARPARPDHRSRPATKADIVAIGDKGIAVKVGDPIAPAGLYASDHDMFAFMVNEELRIKDGSRDGLARGFFVWNSEVGASSFGIMTFLYKFVCGNHIVWGAERVAETRIRHVGTANDKAFGQLEAEVIKYAEGAASDDEARIKQARKFKLGDDRAKVLDAVFNFGIAGLTKSVVSNAYDTAELHTADYGDPRTVWGMVNGLTHASQDNVFGADRTFIDRAAGRLLQAAF